MEQKKTLWIIAAAGAFLLVVLAAAGIMYSPAKNQEQAIRTATIHNEFDSNNANGWKNSQSDDVYQKNIPSSAEKSDLYVFTENATVYELAGKNQNALENQNSAKISENQNGANNSETTDLNLLKEGFSGEKNNRQSVTVTINIPSEKSNDKNADLDYDLNSDAKIAEKTEKNDAALMKNTLTGKILEKNILAKNGSAETNQNQNVENRQKNQKNNGDFSVAKKDAQSSSSANAKTANSKTAQKSSVKTEKLPSVQPKIENPETTQYWVQVASYGNKKGSENARAILDSNKIQADIFTYIDAKDKMFFRVRVGPYITKSEAEYWRAKINKIDEFAKAESYVTSTKS